MKIIKMNKIKDVKSLLEKVEEVTKQKELDLSSGEDLSIGIMNLISIEEHLFYTYNKTRDVKYIDLLNEIRKMRTDLMREIIKNNKDKAEGLFQKSYQLYSLFWGLNLGVVSTKDVTRNTKEQETIEFIDEKSPPAGGEKGSSSVFSKLGALVQKAVDCCKE